jgi:galactose mutarotase-like enzyme
MIPTVVQARRDGFDVVYLRNEAVELQIVPQLGARIVSLRDRRARREWVWHPTPPAPLGAQPLGASFEAAGHGGIDECLPTVGACLWRGRNLPDHGEAWTSAWAMDAVALAQGIVRLRAALPVTPLEVERDLVLNGDEVRLDYRVRNRGASTEEFLWSWHPLFALRAGDRLELPPTAREMRLEVALGLHAGARGDIWSVPRPFPAIDLTRLDLGTEVGACVKGFLGPLPDGEATASLRGAGGESLHLRWARDENPLLGLWLSRGYRGWHHLALEPTCGAPDALNRAVQEWNLCARLAPGATKRWSLSLRLLAGAKAD